jgi:hypothetical protein
MKNIIRAIKKLFGKYEHGYEYWVYFNEIIIHPEFEKTPPRRIKFSQKMDYYLKHGEFQSPILLNKDFELVDGYTSYLIAKKCHIDKVAVYFVG